MSDAAPKAINVYVIGAVDGPQKIGVTARKVEDRRSSLQHGNHLVLEIAFTSVMEFETGYAVERYAHWLLREKFIRGEWFDVSPSEAIAAVDIARRDVDAGKQPGPINMIVPGGKGRPKMYAEDMLARFPPGTFERIAAVLRPGEDRTDFVRAAVEAEIARRKALRTLKAA